MEGEIARMINGDITMTIADIHWQIRVTCVKDEPDQKQRKRKKVT